MATDGTLISPEQQTLLAVRAFGRLTREDAGPGTILEACLDAVHRVAPEARFHEVDDASEPELILPGADDRRDLVVALPADAASLSDLERSRLAAIVGAAAAAMSAAHAVAAARVDTLTGVLSRRSVLRHLEEEIARVQRDETGLACLVIDLDDFKTLNDDLGHHAGDRALEAIGAALLRGIRPFDRVGRIGGDEFVVVMTQVSMADAPAVADRLRTQLAESSDAPTCSFGLASWEDGDGAIELFERADRALLEAKREGGDRLIVAAPATVDDATAEAAEPALRSALRGEGLTVTFQPICALDDGALAGYEALSRGPVGLERPDVLLAAARRAGELVSLDERLHREAFKAAERGNLTAPLSLFVNIEPETLVQIVGDDRFWRRTSRSFASLSEVTERALMDRPGPLLRACQRLRELGWGIALDDVGEDPRAFALLPLIAPDVIKLDLKLVQRAASATLATTMMAVAACVEATGARLIAEGVETEEHRLRGLALGADYGQGFYYGRPEQELVPGLGISPLPRTAPPRLALGVTPFQLVAATTRPRIADEGLLNELQAGIERRALGLGEVAVLACALGDAEPAPRVGRRLAACSHSLGCTAFLAAEPEPTLEGRLFVHRLERDDPLAAEWVCVMVCPYSATVMAARRVDGSPDRWRVAMSHVPETAHAVAAQLLARVP